MEIRVIPAGATLAVHIVFLPLHIPGTQGTLGKCLNQYLGPQPTLPPTSASHLLEKIVARYPSQVPQTGQLKQMDVQGTKGRVGVF